MQTSSWCPKSQTDSCNLKLTRAHPQVKTFPSYNDFEVECSQGIHDTDLFRSTSVLKFHKVGLTKSPWRHKRRQTASLGLVGAWSGGALGCCRCDGTRVENGKGGGVRSWLFLKHLANERNLLVRVGGVKSWSYSKHQQQRQQPWYVSQWEAVDQSIGHVRAAVREKGRIGGL